MIKRILVGISDQPYTIASTQHAIDFAKRCGASLTGISILDLAAIRREAVNVPLGGAGFAADFQAAAFDDAQASIDLAIDSFVRLCGGARVEYEYRKLSGDPFEEFIEQSKFHDLTVCGLQHLFEHGALPEPKDELARLVSAGVRPIFATSGEYREIRRVLIAFSNSVESAKTMRRYTQLSHLLTPQAEVQVVSFGHLGDKAISGLADAKKYLAAHGIHAETLSLDRSPRIGVLEQAEKWQADLIVLGNSAKNLLQRQLFGETALHTINHAKVPLFLSQ